MHDSLVKDCMDKKKPTVWPVPMMSTYVGKPCVGTGLEMEIYYFADEAAG